MTERDQATGLDHTWFRKNESQAGRWTGPDPYSESAHLNNPQSFNKYSYVQGQPTNFIDPSGLLMAIPLYDCRWDPIHERRECVVSGYWFVNDTPFVPSQPPWTEDPVGPSRDPIVNASRKGKQDRDKEWHDCISKSRHEYFDTILNSQKKFIGDQLDAYTNKQVAISLASLLIGMIFSSITTVLTAAIKLFSEVGLVSPRGIYGLVTDGLAAANKLAGDSAKCNRDYEERAARRTTA